MAASVKAVLDTSVVIGLEGGRVSPEALPEELVLPAVVVEELHFGVLMADGDERVRRGQTLASALAAYDVAPVSREIALACAEIRAEGRERRRRYDPFDSLVGATGRVLGLTVLTQDRGFEGMSGVDVRLV